MSASYELAPHRLLELTDGRLAMFSALNRGWAVLGGQEYVAIRSLLTSAAREATPFRGLSADERARAAQALYKIGLATKNGAVSAPCRKSRDIGTPSLLLKMTGACNYGCTYCYDYSDKRWSNRIAEERILGEIRQLVDRYGYISVIFHGGEPLIEFAKIKSVVDTCNRLYPKGRVGYRMQTNGSLLDDKKVAFLQENGVAVGISLDGIDGAADAMRPLRKKSRTATEIFESILGRYPEFVREQCGVLSVIGRHNLETLPGFILWLQERGVAGISFSFLDPVGKGDHAYEQVPSPQEAVQLYRTLIGMLERREIEELRITSLIIYLDILSSFNAPHICYKGPCGAGEEFFVLDSNGTRRSCDCIIDDFFEVDEAERSGETANPYAGARRRVEQRHAWLQEEGPCADCALMRLCGGTCIAKAIGYGGHAKSVYPIECALSKFVFPELIERYAEDPHGPIFQYHRRHSAVLPR